MINWTLSAGNEGRVNNAREITPPCGGGVRRQYGLGVRTYVHNKIVNILVHHKHNIVTNKVTRMYVYNIQVCT